jgi:mannose-6-phosphate isomerase-like protein (cupin superfamily)
MTDTQVKVQADRPASPRQGITIFREADAPMLHDAGMMENHSSAVANAGLMQMMEAGVGDGYVLKCLYKSPDPDGFSLSYAWFKGNYALPPHTHDADCLYYVISGEIHMGDNVLGAGDGFLVPANALYSYSVGPEGLEVLEIRNSTQFDITVRDGSPRAWERLAAICEANNALWKTQGPPVRRPQVSAGDTGEGHAPG